MFESFRKLFAANRKPTAPLRRARLNLEVCESRTLLSGGPVLLKSAHELLINPSTLNDHVTVSTSGSNVVVNFDGKSTSFSASSIKEIVFKAGSGNDFFVNDSAIPSYEKAGSGNDTLIGGNGNDTLIGGSGIDVLLAGPGKNKVVGSSKGSTHAVMVGSKDTLTGIATGNLLDGGQELIASLTGTTGAFGFASYVASTTTAGQNNFELCVTGLTASTTYTVEVGGTSIGTFTTDSSGAGSLTLSNLTTAIAAGSALTIVDPSSTTVLQGTFAAGDDHGGGNCQGGQDLTATLTGTTGSGSAEFKTSSTAGQNSFTLMVTGLTASTTYTVEIGGTSIGTFTTDSTGAGSLTLSDLTTPPIASGSMLTVVDAGSNTVLQGTFAPSSECHHGEELVASLTGAPGTSGTADFKSDNSAGQNSFTLTVAGLTASTTYTVDVGGSSIGTITTDSTGAGSLTLSDLTTTIAASSVLTVVDASNNTVLTGTFAIAAEGGGGDCHGGQDLTASLTGATGTSGTADFKTSSTAGQNSFTLTVSGLTASTTYTVEVGTTTIGTFTTDSTGAGSLTLSNLTTTIATGSVLTVLDASSNTVLQGTFAQTGDGGGDGDGCGGGDHQGGQALNASLTGATGTTGTAWYQTGDTSGQNSLTVKVSGLTASTTYTVEIGGTSVGTFTTDSTGAGLLTLNNIAATIASSTVLTIVDANGNTILTGAFVTGDGWGGWGGGGWGGGGGGGGGDGGGDGIGRRLGGF
jgi:hypothetical protein